MLARWAGRLRDVVVGGGRIGWVQVHTVSRPPAESFVSALTAKELEQIAAAAADACPTAQITVHRGAA